MSARLPLALVLLVSVGCGRDSVGLLGGSDGDGGRRDGSVLGTDGPIVIDEGPPLGKDSGPGPDRPPPPPPDGGETECFSRRDCFDRYGPPPACMEGPSIWECNRNRCEVECLPSECRNDCDCPFELACFGGSCRVANRLNQCCFNPACPPGDFCVLPGGGQDVCPPPPPDAGVRDTGFPPPPDGGPPPPDGGVIFDGGRPDSGTLVTPVGDPCAVQSMCGPIGFCIDQSQGFPDGYCSQSCSPQGGQPCPTGSVCRGFGGGNNICLDACASNAECRMGYLCVQVGLDPQRVCWPAGGGSTNPNGNAVGGSCGGDNDCLTGLTCLSFMGWPGGYCTKQFCDPLNNPCPSGSSCFNFPGSFSICLDDCPNGGTQSDCRPGYYCLGPTGQPGGCIPN